MKKLMLIMVLIMVGCVNAPKEINGEFAFGVVEETFTPIIKSESFYQDTNEIFLLLNFKNYDLTEVTANWVYEDEDFLIQEYTQKIKDKAWFSLSKPNDGWPIGNYRVDIKNNNEIIEFFKFNVIEDSVEVNKLYFDLELGFSTKYPSHWIYEKPNEYSVEFSGDFNTEEYYVTAVVQNIMSKEKGGTFNNVEEVVELWKQQIIENQGTITEETTDKHIMETGTFDFYYFEGTYIYMNEEFKQLNYFYDREDGYFQVIKYTAPTTIFNKYSDVFSKIIYSNFVIR